LLRQSDFTPPNRYLPLVRVRLRDVDKPDSLIDLRLAVSGRKQQCDPMGDLKGVRARDAWPDRTVKEIADS